jgi:hypothetical protein
MSVLVLVLMLQDGFAFFSLPALLRGSGGRALSLDTYFCLA